MEVMVGRGGPGLLSYLIPILPTAIVTGVIGAGLGIESDVGIAALVVSGLGGAGLIERTIFSVGTRKWFETMIRLMDALSDTVGGETDNIRDG